MKPTVLLLFLTISIFSSGQDPKITELGKIYMSGDYDQTIAKANEYLADDTNNLEYKSILGRALFDMGETESALPILEYVVKNDKNNTWTKAWSLAYLGKSYFMLSEYLKSENALKACIELNATKNATNEAYSTLILFGFYKFFNDWEIIESDNFRFHFQKKSDTDKKLFIDTRETAFQKINGFFNSGLPKKIDFFVWESADDAKLILRRELGFADPAYCIVHSRSEQTVGHEMTHVISNYSAKKIIKTGLINEGTAVCFDLTHENKEEIIVKWLESNNEQIDIKGLWSNWQKYPHEFSYPLSGIFVKGLIDKFGKEMFIKFFTNQTYENAKTIFGNDIDTYISDFEKKYNS